jgi:hypothetical protein
MTPEWIQAIAAVATLFAAIAAAVIAFQTPKLAAQYAEEYRRKNAAIDEQRAFQQMIFRALMKGRNELASLDTRAAINLVEVAFPNDTKVRNARRMFTKAASAQPFQAERLIECFNSLIQAVAEAVGLGEAINRFDIESGYYPEVLGKLDAAALHDAEMKLAVQGPNQ